MRPVRGLLLVGLLLVVVVLGVVGLVAANTYLGDSGVGGVGGVGSGGVVGGVEDRVTVDRLRVVGREAQMGLVLAGVSGWDGLDVGVLRGLVGVGGRVVGLDVWPEVGEVGFEVVGERLWLVGENGGRGWCGVSVPVAGGVVGGCVSVERVGSWLPRKALLDGLIPNMG
ncbi:MAG: hypothetical protein WC184_11625 [Acidimicrobiia bacterium]